MTTQFSVSYESLLRKLSDIKDELVQEDNKKDVHYLPAYSVLSYNTVLVAMLSGGKVQLKDKTLAARAAKLAEKHNDVKLSTGELLKLSNWVDANFQYYGSYWGRRQTKFKNKPSFRPSVTFDQAISVDPPKPTQKK